MGLRGTAAAVLCAAALVVAAHAQDARAQGAAAQPAQPAQPAQDAYKQHMANGVKLFQDKNFAAAIAEFEAAYRERPGPNPLVNVALSHKGLFHYPKAIAALERALREHGAEMSADDKKAAEAAIAEMRGLLAFVDVTVEPEGATLFVDGEKQPPGAWKSPIPLGPGAHRLAAEAPGYARAEQTITVASGTKHDVVALKLVQDQGRVTIAAKHPDTAIAIDGKPSGAGKWAGFLPPGTHQIEFFEGGTRVSSTQVLVVAGKEQQVREGDAHATKGPGDVPATPELPPMRGLYFIAGALFFFPTGRPGKSDDLAGTNEVDTSKELSTKTGGGLSLRAGYRFTNVYGLDLMFEYFNLEKNVTEENRQQNEVLGEYAYRSFRAGPNLRLMSPGRRVRFVGVLGLGAAYETARVPLLLSGDPATGEVRSTSRAGFTGYFNSETGIELDFGGVLVGVTAQQTVTPDAGTLGGAVRVGYGTW